MDRLRSMQYFIAAAEEGSFSAAARKLEITIPAVAKLVGSLEASLGVKLFERSAQGLALTTVGETYLESCRPAVDALQDLDEQVRSSTVRVRGTIVVGIQHFVAHALLAPMLPRFHALYPEIEIDLRESTQVVDHDAPGVDAYLSLGWPTAPDMVHRPLGSSGFVVCASPSYWARQGVPAHPRELANHNCMLIRTQQKTVMDLWSFKRGDEQVSLAVKGWLVVNNAHRDTVIKMALAGEGVVRILDWTNREELESGRLVQALTDWESGDSPTINLSYRPSARRIAKVKVFIDFVQEAFKELQRGTLHPTRKGPAPKWAYNRMGHASGPVHRKA